MLTSKTFRILSLVLCAAFLLSVFPVPSGVYADETIVSSSNVISSALSDRLATLSDDDTVEVAIWQYAVDESVVEEQAYKLSGMRATDLGNKDIEAVQSYISAKRSSSKTLYSKLNRAFKTSYLDTKSDVEILYKSRYSPMIIARMTKSDVLATASISSVSSINLHTNAEFVPCSDIANQNSGANYLKSTYCIDRENNGSTLYDDYGNLIYLKGQDINIGMVELAKPNLNSGYFNTSKLHLVRDYSGNTDTANVNHATLVAAIMVGKETIYNGVTYEGIVPKADLYYGTISDSLDFYGLIEDMLENEVSTINVSGNFYNTAGFSYGEYDNMAIWIDHIAFDHDVHFVAAAGDTRTSSIIMSQKYLLSSAAAYNAITVGCISDSNTIINSYAPATLSADDMEVDSFYLNQSSAYLMYSQYSTICKPDILASGDYIRFASLINSGSSFAAPQVTAFIAQLCQYQPNLLTNNSGVKAILAASALYRANSDTETYNNSQLMVKQGAGVVNARCALEIVKWNELGSVETRKLLDYTLASGQTSFTKTIQVPSNKTYLRVAMSWIKKNRHNSNQSHYTDIPSTTTLANFKIEVFKGDSTASANLVASSNTNTNLDVLHFMLTQTGKYTIKVTLLNSSSVSGSQYVSIAWY